MCLLFCCKNLLNKPLYKKKLACIMGNTEGSKPEVPDGGIAQLVERLLCTQDVRSSSPLTSTIKDRILSYPVFY